MAPTEIVYLGAPPVRIDILHRADGLDTERIDRAVRIVVGELSIPVISLEDLIVKRRAAGRAQDLADVLLLERVLRR